MTRGDISGTSYVNRVMRYRPIIWIGRFTVNHPDIKARPICVLRDTYGPQLPINNLYVSPDHNWSIHGVLVPSCELIDGSIFFKHVDAVKTEYYHIELDKPSVIVAEGILSVSYTNINNRYIFQHTIHKTH